MKRPAGFATGPGAPMTIATIPEVLAELQAGRMIILVDDPGRENEGDLAMLAEKVTPEAINFMAREGRGLVCMPLAPEICEQLELAPQTASQHEQDGHRLHGLDRGRPGRHDRHQRPRPRPHDPGRLRGRTPSRATWPGPATSSRCARARAACWCAAARPRASSTSRASRGSRGGGRDLRDHARRRHDGAHARSGGLRPAPRAQDLHDREPDRLAPDRTSA